MRLTENDQRLIAEAIEFMSRKLTEEAASHYETFTFKPRFPGECWRERYVDTYCSYERGLMTALQEIAFREDKPTQAEIEASWRENPDRMGGQFTEEELNRSGWL